MARQLLDVAMAASAAENPAGSRDSAAPDAKLWQQQHAAAEGPASATVTPAQLRVWRHWAAALPPFVPLAFAHASEAEILALGDGDLAQEALAVQDLMLSSFQASLSS